MQGGAHRRFSCGCSRAARADSGLPPGLYTGCNIFEASESVSESISKSAYELESGSVSELASELAPESASESASQARSDSVSSNHGCDGVGQGRATVARRAD